ncbi:MAG: UDP-N-acetylglucosamine 2-epimerase (non-hydrolyzing) [Patescibacteria group bacterium]
MNKKIICSVVGARPQFIKLAPLSKQLQQSYNEVIIHTGQHYDKELSKIFFDTLNIPKPDYNLNVRSGTHGAQTGIMLAGLEKLFTKLKPKLVLVFGDTNSTLAGALAAAKMHIPVAHVESGMRSFNKKMPEERNRIITDHISDILFCSTQQSKRWLEQENITRNVHVVGDLMIDALMDHAKIAMADSHVIHDLNIKPKSYYLSTIHRAENTDSKFRLENILAALAKSNKRVILPLHPRTKKMIKKHGLSSYLHSKQLLVIPPVSYLDMLQLEMNALKIATDSGGIQKEAYFFKVPCVTLRDETEWLETVKGGWNVVTGVEKKKILNALRKSSTPRKHTASYGSGNAAKKIVVWLNAFLSK